MTRRICWFLCLWFCVAMAPASSLKLRAQGKPETRPEEEIRANYTKYEYMIPMRDGRGCTRRSTCRRTRRMRIRF